ncbi:MAG TPA: hypothetical protein VGD36_04115 [Xanthobacteraceae bacterium]
MYRQLAQDGGPLREAPADFTRLAGALDQVPNVQDDVEGLTLQGVDALLKHRVRLVEIGSAGLVTDDPDPDRRRCRQCCQRPEPTEHAAGQPSERHPTHAKPPDLAGHDSVPHQMN